MPSLLILAAVVPVLTVTAASGIVMLPVILTLSVTPSSPKIQLVVSAVDIVVAPAAQISTANAGIEIADKQAMPTSLLNVEYLKDRFDDVRFTDILFPTKTTLIIYIYVYKVVKNFKNMDWIDEGNSIVFQGLYCKKNSLSTKLQRVRYHIPLNKVQV